MGLEMLSLHNTVHDQYGKANSLQETNRRLLIGAGILAVYMFIGAVTFVRLEQPYERIERETYGEYIQNWRGRLVTAGFTDEDVDELLTNVYQAVKNGMFLTGERYNETNWSFGQAFFFCGTLLSTVGYGRISPRTPSGKLFTIFYCLFGIPLTLAFLSALVAKFRQPSHWLRAKMNAKLGDRATAGQIQILHLTSLIVFLLIFIFLIPSALFVLIEQDWGFLDAIYYCFVSLTTIGLGDFEPGDNYDQPLRGFYKVMCTGYLLVGLTCMMLFLATLYDIPEMNISRFFLVEEIFDDEETPFNKSTSISYSRQKNDTNGNGLCAGSTSASHSSTDLYAH